MDPNNLIKVITAIFTVVFAILAAVIEIKKNPKYWLNRFFGMFFVFAALGFLFYTIYHLIFTDADLVIVFATVGQVCFNIAMGCLLQSELIVEYSEKVALNKRYILMNILLFVVSTFGYVIWPIQVNMDAYVIEEVDTITKPFLFYPVFLYRIILMLYVVIKFSVLSKKTSGTSRQQLMLFTYGMICIILGTLLTLLGGSLLDILETIGLLAFDVGAVIILRGFLLKQEKF
ncbi:MAG: hypothetical protein E4G98_02075 [Promethearchaeota archaeon]|nr:MAG: hypothetical protein E4G98_02075 [Candidatus Lokiarchaeota archaeon]